MIIRKTLVDGGEVKIGKLPRKTLLHDELRHSHVIKAVITRKIRVTRIKFQRVKNHENGNEDDEDVEEVV